MSVVKSNALQIGQSATATNNLTWYQPSSPDGTVRLGVGNAGATTSDVVTINSSGNLGLGVTPSAWIGLKAFQINAQASLAADSTSTQLSSNAYYGSGGWKYIGTGYAANYYQDSGQHVWRTAASGSAGGTISFTQAMTLDASGNLLVGTTSNTEGTRFWLSGPAGAATSIVQVGANGNGAFVFRNASNSSQGNITVNASSVTFNSTSDQRLKENIVDAPSAINSINSIKVRSFDWKSDGTHVDYGYIAQELLEVVPEAVSVPADADDMMGVDFGKLTPRLVKAIQELSAQVTTLQAEINELKA